MQFAIHLDRKVLEIMEYSEEIAIQDMKVLRVKYIEELNDHTFQVFRKEWQAEKFLDKYNSTLKSLKCIKGLPRMPGMKYSRRYLTLASMGVKLSTVRHYRKDWEPGTLFRFCDQTYYVLCELRSITKHKNGWKYDYSVME